MSGAPVSIGILGGGQLGMMLLEANEALGFEVGVLDHNPQCSCASVTSRVTVGDVRDKDDVVNFGKQFDVVTIEFEHVSIEGLLELERQGVCVYPQPHIIKLIQDKGEQKLFYQRHGFPTAPFMLVERGLDVPDSMLPAVLKLRREGYDGKGVQVVSSSKDLASSFQGPCVVEEKIEIQMELSVIVARSVNGDIATFDPVELVADSRMNLLDYLVYPSRLDAKINEEAVALAEALVRQLEFVGLLAVEFLLDKSGKLYINEIAPRPHNSGHHTIEACEVSQFTQHLLAISGAPLRVPALRSPAVMFNLVGVDVAQVADKLGDKESGVFIHDYHKGASRPGRKMGHVTILSESFDYGYSVMKRIKEVY